MPVLGLLPEEIASEFSLSEAFRGRQIFSRLWQGASSFNEMTSLPLALRERLSETGPVYRGVPGESVFAPDGAMKARITFPGEPPGEGGAPAAVEAMLLFDRQGRKTACVSSQAGCALGCAFCKTGRLGLLRSLRAAEIAEQFLFLEKAGGPLSSLVFMGMGEPLLNLDAVLKTVSLVTHKAGRNLSPRRITVSTAGITEGVYALADKAPPVRLAVSVPSADEALRRSLMPAAAENPLGELQKAILYYGEKTGRRCTLETVLLSGVNTDPRNMKLLSELAKKTRCHVNLIPWNAVEGIPFSPPPDKECRKALSLLEAEGVNATLRTSRGGAIAGACGQLGEGLTSTLR